MDKTVPDRRRRRVDYLVVSGMPAAGKSTVAAGLAAQSSMPVFDKDLILVERRTLSTRADSELASAVCESPHGIVVSWWQHPASQADSGTPIAWLRDLRGIVVELYCECVPEVAVERFRRRTCHPGHMDDRWSDAALLARMIEAAQLGPLNVGAVLKIDTERPIGFGLLWARVQGLSRGPNRPQRMSVSDESGG